MSLETSNFEFDEFLLDVKERVLLRDGKPLSITPKAFQLLQILVENHGHLVEREELLNKIWGASFVEEGNLKVTIRHLRKILGDEKQSPRFIETVPRRGYRFIAEVKKVSAGQLPENALPRSKSFLAPIIGFSIFLVSTIAIGSRYLHNTAPNAPILSAPFASEKLTTNGKTHHAVISPDSKTFALAQGDWRHDAVLLKGLK